MSLSDYEGWVREHYGKHDVMQACLSLQDSHHLMVPILLHAVWLAQHQNWRVKAQAYHRAMVLIRQFVMPLRAQRMMLRGGDIFDDAKIMRQRLKKTEITLELDIMHGLHEASGPDIGLDASDVVRRHVGDMGHAKLNQDMMQCFDVIGAPYVILHPSVS
ncbi:MAG: TIGR02444 family protein [Alphaproteobacteria bacterium]